MLHKSSCCVCVSVVFSYKIFNLDWIVFKEVHLIIYKKSVNFCMYVNGHNDKTGGIVHSYHFGSEMNGCMFVS